MRRTNTITKFHPKAPRKLVRLYKQHEGSCYRLGKFLDINPSHIWQLLKYGHEPRRYDLREKLFLRVPKKRQKAEVPEFVRQWNRLEKAERHKVIQQYLKWRKANETNRTNPVPD